MRNRVVAVVLVLGAGVLAGCDGGAAAGGERYETVADLHEAVTAVSGVDCEYLSDVTRYSGIHEDFAERFAGLAGFGTCLGEDDLVLRVFDSDEARADLVGSDAWVELERVFHCVDDGDVFLGVAGGNWLVVDAGEPTRALDPASGIAADLGGEEVLSQEAAGSSGSCD